MTEINCPKSVTFLLFRILNLQRHTQIADVTDQELEEKVWEIVGSNTMLGYRAVKARLEVCGIRVPEKHVQEVLRLINPLAVAQFRYCKHSPKLKYTVQFPFRLWEGGGGGAFR